MTILKPSECSEEMIQIFHDLVLKGNQVNPNTLMVTIRGSVSLGFIYDNGIIISVASIKQPVDSYKNKVFKSANVPSIASMFKYEIGHAYTEPQHRKKGHHLTLLKALIESLPGERFYATTKQANVPSLLLKTGFTQSGTPYKNTDGETLTLFTRDITK